jgi:hypothetical protein
MSRPYLDCSMERSGIKVLTQKTYCIIKFYYRYYNAMQLSTDLLTLYKAMGYFIVDHEM